MAGYSKTRLRMEQAIRLELTNLGLSDADIAEHVGLTPSGYAQMKMQPEYKALRTTMVTGVLSDLDIELLESKKDLRTKLRQAVPIALNTLVEAALKHVTDPKLAVQASCEILDREGTFVKTSRTVHIEDDADHAAKISKHDDAIADDLINSLNKAKARASLDDSKPATDKIQ